MFYSILVARYCIIAHSNGRNYKKCVSCIALALFWSYSVHSKQALAKMQVNSSINKMFNFNEPYRTNHMTNIHWKNNLKQILTPCIRFRDCIIMTHIRFSFLLIIRNITFILCHLGKKTKWGCSKSDCCKVL